jgi:hypothetical protein
MTYTITPRLAANNDRVTMRISYAEHRRMAGRDLRASGPVEVFDQITGTLYRVESAPCSLPRCHCDAIATPVEYGGGGRG